MLLPNEPTEDALVDLDDEQWWLYEWYVTKETNSWGDSSYGSYTMSKVTEQHALEAATLTTNNSHTLLVYASDKAMAGERTPLSKALMVCYSPNIHIV